MRAVYLLLCIALTRDSAANIVRHQLKPQTGPLSVQLLDDVGHHHHHTHGRKMHHHHSESASHESKSIESKESKENKENRDSKERYSYDDISDYPSSFRSEKNWNSPVYSTLITQGEEIPYGDVIEWRGVQIAAGPNSPVEKSKDIEDIFKDAYKTMQHVSEKDKKKLHEVFENKETKYDEVHANATHLLKKHKYGVEEHIVKTDDGYYLTLFRIKPRDDTREKQDKQNKHDNNKQNMQKNQEEQDKNSSQDQQDQFDNSSNQDQRDQYDKNSSQNQRDQQDKHRSQNQWDQQDKHSSQDERDQQNSSDERDQHSEQDKRDDHNKRGQQDNHLDKRDEQNQNDKWDEQDNQNNQELKKRPVVLLMHGLLGSADDWLLMGPKKSLAYMLSDAGFDVWLGNARGNKYSRNHASKHESHPDFWKFSMDEIALHDVPAIIDHALKTSGQKKLHYVGHSQGNAVFFALAATRPEYREKVEMMHALSPMVYMTNIRSPLLRMISPNSKFYERLHDQLGHAEFKPSKEVIHTVGGNMCQDVIGCKHVCSNINFVMSGVDTAGMDFELIPSILGHLPAGTSTRHIKHYGQAVASREFRKYDYGPSINRKIYGQRQPPKYDLKQVKVPVVLYSSEEDWLSHPKDVERLRKELPNVRDHQKVPEKHFSHLDFQFSEKAPEMVYKRLIESIQKH